MHLLARVDVGELAGDGAVLHVNHRGDLVGRGHVRRRVRSLYRVQPIRVQVFGSAPALVGGPG